jgi:hypothetical protein
MVRLKLCAHACILLLCVLPIAAQSWSALNNKASFAAGTALLLTDGTIMVHHTDAGEWWKLTPDIFGSYINGTWKQMATLPSGYGPLYYASAVLPDGRLLIEGGEYNFGAQIDTNLGAIYDPAANTWTSVTPPSGWSNIGDAPCVVLPNGVFMLANPFGFNMVTFTASTLTWTPVGSGKADSFSEEGMTLLPNGDVMVVDTENGTHAERYNINLKRWGSANSTIVPLPYNGGLGIVPELGPGVLRPDGTVFVAGATGNTAIYFPAASRAGTGFWEVGPVFPAGLAADAPGALLPDGNVLVSSSPFFTTPTTFFEFDGFNLNSVPAPPNAPNTPSYTGRMLVLPTGQILYTDGSTDVEIYSAAGTYNQAWAPLITSVPSLVTRGTTNSISGQRFNGMSQGAAYGDDATMATNYPLVRIVNNSTGHVFYAKTHGHTNMGVATGTRTISTNFDVPSSMETGASTLYVVANGIPSFGVAITVN